MTSMLPVILCGRTIAIASGVIAALKPEIDVIHLCLTRDAAKLQIPAILMKEPVTTEVELGSKNYTHTPKAIILGAGYDDEDIAALRKACHDAKTPLVPWLKPDTSIPTPPLGPEYGKALVERIKLLIVKLENEKKNGNPEGTDEVILY